MEKSDREREREERRKRFNAQQKVNREERRKRFNAEQKLKMQLEDESIAAMVLDVLKNRDENLLQINQDVDSCKLYDGEGRSKASILVKDAISKTAEIYNSRSVYPSFSDEEGESEEDDGSFNWLYDFDSPELLSPVEPRQPKENLEHEDKDEVFPSKLLSEEEPEPEPEPKPKLQGQPEEEPEPKPEREEVFCLADLFRNDEESEEMLIVSNDAFMKVRVRIRGNGEGIITYGNVELRVTVTSKGGKAEQWIIETSKSIRQCSFVSVVALDLLSRKNGGIDVLVIVHKNRCLLFQIAKASRVPVALERFFLMENINFVEGRQIVYTRTLGSYLKERGLSGKLQRVHQLVSYLAADHPTCSKSLKDVVEVYLNYKMIGLGTSCYDWSEANLESSKVAAAAINAYMLTILHNCNPKVV